MSRGEVDIRVSHKTGKARLRFFGVAQDQLESITLALELARLECETKHDCVSLEAICLSYLNSAKGKKAIPKLSSARP